jgi:hypothetical protein
MEPTKVETVQSTPDVEPTKVETVQSTPDVEPTKVETVQSTPDVEPTKVETVQSTPDVEPTKVETVQSTPDVEPTKVETVQSTPQNVKSETELLCEKIVEKIANIESKIEEYNSVQETLKSYASKGFNVEASLKDLELQKENVSTLEEKTNEKLTEILKMFD